MKKITIELPESHDDVISITAIGLVGTQGNVATSAFDLNRGTHLKYTGERWFQEVGAEHGES